MKVIFLLTNIGQIIKRDDKLMLTYTTILSKSGKVRQMTRR